MAANEPMDDNERRSAFMSALVTEYRLANLECLRGIARIRGYYRSLTPEAAVLSSAESGRRPEGQSTPSLWSGVHVALLTSAATMIAFINSIVAGTGVTLIANRLLGGDQVGRAVGFEVVAAAGNRTVSPSDVDSRAHCRHMRCSDGGSF